MSTEFDQQRRKKTSCDCRKSILSYRWERGRSSCVGDFDLFFVLHLSACISLPREITRVCCLLRVAQIRCDTMLYDDDDDMI